MPDASIRYVWGRIRLSHTVRVSGVDQVNIDPRFLLAL